MLLEVRENVDEMRKFAFEGYGKCWGNKMLALVVRENAGEIRLCFWLLEKILGKEDFACGC